MKADLVLDVSESHLYGVIGGISINAHVAHGHHVPHEKHGDAHLTKSGVGDLIKGALGHAKPGVGDLIKGALDHARPGLAHSFKDAVHLVKPGLAHVFKDAAHTAASGLSFKPSPLPAGPDIKKLILKHFTPHLHKPAHKPTGHGHHMGHGKAKHEHHTVAPGLYAMTVEDGRGGHGHIVHLHPLHLGHKGHAADVVLHGPGTAGGYRSIALSSSAEVAKICKGISAAHAVKHGATLVVTDHVGKVTHGAKLAALKHRP